VLVLCRCFIFRASGDVHPAPNRPRPAAGEPPPAMTARSQAQTGRAVILIVGAAMDAGHHGPPDDAIATGFSAPRRHFRYDASSAVPAARTWFFVTTTPLAQLRRAAEFIELVRRRHRHRHDGGATGRCSRSSASRRRIMQSAQSRRRFLTTLSSAGVAGLAAYHQNARARAYAYSHAVGQRGGRLIPEKWSAPLD
jgi:hypothetical protein